uniref:RRM domain-containing protein n=1 Tax=Oryza brachyantha TaxID=4533 RepID=J3MQ09_ORYBR
MEVPELAKLAFSRVQRVEPENVGKIMGVMLLREPDEDEMVQLAYGTDAALLARIDDAKAALAVIYARCSAVHGPGGGGGGGMCKNGQSCQYSHHQAAYQDHAGGDVACGTPGSLETLELEIAELLNSRRGQPVSIASLPTLYGEKYGKGLQADGYLTESQRHGKAGFSLTRLLSRLNKIRVIERPHGQHSVVLAEDAGKYMDFRGGGGGGDTGSVPASAHQIYLTFPAESTFTEDDVANYFGQYGAVRDVRIPCQERRMFGFVSFHSPETVSTILMRRNPHFICGSRVLVKPYREKSKCVDNLKSMPPPYSPSRFFDFDQDLYTAEFDASRLMRKQLAEKHERMLEMERRHAAVRRLESLTPQFAYFDCSIDDHSFPEESKQLDIMNTPFASTDPLEIVSADQSPPTQPENSYGDHESSQVELLPESPFASSAPAGNIISAII